jgi:hypothetical protein
MATIPLSNTNIATLIGIESAYGSVATNGFRLAYEQNTLVRNQALEKNTELRGGRQMGTSVPGVKNPGGTLLFHQTDQTLPFALYAALGAMDAGTISPQAAPTAALINSAGIVTSGAHSYAYVVTDGLGNTRGSSASNAVTTVEATDGQVTVTKAGTLPTGWTWAIYRTHAGEAASPLTGFQLIPSASALAASVTSFVDNIADATLTSAYPGSFTADDETHVITIADTLPSYTIERSHPYVAATKYYAALGCVVNKATISVKGTGYFDIGLDWLFASLSGPNASSFDATPTDWRSGTKIHHAMALAAKVKLDGAAFAKFLDLKIDHMNNLNTEDVPVGGTGDHASHVPMQAETQVTGTLKVCDDTDISMVQDTSTTHTMSIQWDFPTLSHYCKIELAGVQFDPTDPSPSGQGILKFSANGFASQPGGGQQIIATIFNGVPTATYKT